MSELALHRIQTTKRGAVAARYRLNGRKDFSGFSVEEQAEDIWTVTFLAPKDADLGCLRPDILPPEAAPAPVAELAPLF